MEGAPPSTAEARDSQTEDSACVRPSPEDLVARAIAPVKNDHLRPPPSRPRTTTEGEGDASGEKTAVNFHSNVAKEKKSKRQLKRERQQEQRSALHICPAVAKEGKMDACRYSNNCRFSHDFDAFLAQKPADLEGTCPFVAIETPCPYGVTCRFFNTHRKNDPSESQSLPNEIRKINSLNKDLQKLLWKNKVKFPKADAQLKHLGLSGGKNARSVVDTTDANLHGSNNLLFGDGNEMHSNSVDEMECAPTTCMEEKCLDDESVADDLNFLKKAKGLNEEHLCMEINNGACYMGKDSDLQKEQNGLEKTSIVSLASYKVDLSPKSHAREKKLIDFSGKLYLAPLTTVGNLPFRRVCKVLGADITCGEMAMCTNLLQGQASEWALLRRHHSEDLFGVQICGAYPDTVARAVELIDRECTINFIDINMGCPIDIVVNKGAGSSLLTKPMRMKGIIQAASGTIDKPITVKVRTGYFEGRNRIDSLVSDISSWGASALTIHGRSRQQRYSKLADWEYIYQCTKKAPDTMQVLGNGDICSYSDWNKHTTDCPELSTCMVARGALIKPWIFTEIKEQRHWDITSGERFNIFKDFINFGLEHWGSDSKGTLNPKVLLELFSMYREWQEEKAKKISHKQEEIENKIETVDALAVKLLQRLNYSVSTMRTTSHNFSEVYPLQVEVGELKGRFTEVLSNCDALCKRIAAEGPETLRSSVTPFSASTSPEFADPSSLHKPLKLQG